MIGMTLCSGIGAPEMAAPWVDWRFASEIEPFPRDVLQQRFDYKLPAEQNQGEALLWGDMTEVTPDLLRDRGVPLPELLVAGTPCQAFSIAGLRKGVEDERGNLTLKFVEICHAIVDARSDGKLVVLWENVPGVLSDKGNAFGNFLGGLVGADDALCHPSGESWPSEGMVEGPRARLVWRVLDAQYFGLAQRRKRVFVVVDFGGAIDPAKVLFERQGLQGNTPPSRETGQEATGGSGSGASHWSGGPHPSLNQSHNTGGIGASNQEIFSQQGAGIVEATHDVAGTMISRQTSGGFSNSIDHAAGGYMAIHHEATGYDKQAIGEYGDNDIASTCSARDHKDATDLVVAVFDPNQITSKTNRSTPSPELSHTLPAAPTPPVMFPIMPQNSGKDYKAREVDVTQPLMAGGPVGGNQGGDFIVKSAVAFAQNQVGEVRVGDVENTLNTNFNASGRNTAMTQYGPTVRRLMPLECARLQGFLDDHCAITYRGKPATDGPQYKAYGNSMAVKNIKWIMDRIREYAL